VGEGLAYELAKRGAKLILSARRESELKRVKSACQTADEDVQILPLDLSENSNYDPLVQKAIQFFGRIDILINNGGISQRSYFKDTKISVFREIMEVNFFGTVSLTKALLPHFQENKEGMFVAVTSVTGKFGTPLRTGYAASKHALHGFYDALRAECYEDNLKVLLVAAGYIQTNLSLNALVGDGQRQGKMDQGQINGLSPEKCAKIIISAIQKDKKEIYPGGFKEVSGVYLKRFFPAILRRVVREVNVR